MLAMLLVYGPHKSILPDAEELSKTENVLYGTFHRFLWGLVLAWVTYACHYGAGGLFLFFRFQYFLLCVPDYPINISPCRKPITREIIINLVLSVYENRIEQCFAAHIVKCCQQYCSTFLHLIQPRRYYSIFLFNNIEQCWQDISSLFIDVEQVDNFFDLLASVAPHEQKRAEVKSCCLDQGFLSCSHRWAR